MTDYKHEAEESLSELYLLFWEHIGEETRQVFKCARDNLRGVARERDAALERERQKDRQIADLREALCDLEEMATKCDDGQYIDYPGARSIFCRARSALAKAYWGTPTEGTSEDSVMAAWVIGDMHPVYGVVEAMGVISGESYRWLVDADGVVTMIPLAMLEGESDD